MTMEYKIMWSNMQVIREDFFSMTSSHEFMDQFNINALHHQNKEMHEGLVKYREKQEI